MCLREEVVQRTTGDQQQASLWVLEGAGVAWQLGNREGSGSQGDSESSALGRTESREGCGVSL